MRVSVLKSIWRIPMLKVLRENCKDLTLLYVEDDKELSLRTTEVFKNLFKSVDVAYDGKEGLDVYMDYLSTNGSPYDLVITDINMPRMNGIELCKAILKQTQHQYIVIISAHNESAYLFEAIDLGISSFISKPISQGSLMQALNKAAKSVNEHKLAESYLASLEALSIELEKKNQELAAKNAQLEKSTRLLNTVSKKKEILNPKKKMITSNADKNTALSKQQVLDFIKDDLYALTELLTEIDLVIIDNLNNIEAVTIDSAALLSSLLKKYALTLSMYPFFDELSLAMSEFANTLNNAPLPVNQERIKNSFLLLECFVFDLTRWHDDLSSGDESRFNTIDASNIGNMHLISNMWLEKDSDDGKSNLDDIFDF